MYLETFSLKRSSEFNIESCRPGKMHQERVDIEEDVGNDTKTLGGNARPSNGVFFRGFTIKGCPWV